MCAAPAGSSQRPCGLGGISAVDDGCSTSTASQRRRSRSLPLASLTKAQANPRKPDAAVAPPPPVPTEKPATDVVAGAMARAASQSTIHPLDTIKVRMQAGRPKPAPPLGQPLASASAPAGPKPPAFQSMVLEVASLYKGVLGAATGAGIIIGSYFAFYSNAKRILRQHSELSEGSIAFVSGAAAAVGSSVVKVPIAVCIRSVQAGVYPNAINAAKSIISAAGVQGLFTGFLPTLLEDVPDMAVKFTVYESFRAIHIKLQGEQPSTWQDLLMGGTAGAAAAAATTPVDVVKTRMMCSASSRPTIVAAVKGIWEEGGHSWKAFFRGVGPRALSNGLNSAIFFCFFEAIRRVLWTRQQEREDRLQLQQQQLAAAEAEPSPRGGSRPASLTLASRHGSFGRRTPQAAPPLGQGSSRFACLSLAIPLASCGLH